MLGNTQMVKLMLKYGADIHIKTAKNESPFYLAAYHLIQNAHNKDASCIHALYYAGADINCPNSKGYNPLQLACMFGHTALVKWLLAKGVDQNVIPNPYMLARMQGHNGTAELLKKQNLKSIA